MHHSAPQPPLRPRRPPRAHWSTPSRSARVTAAAARSGAAANSYHHCPGNQRNRRRRLAGNRLPHLHERSSGWLSWLSLGAVRELRHGSRAHADGLRRSAWMRAPRRVVGDETKPMARIGLQIGQLHRVGMEWTVVVAPAGRTRRTVSGAVELQNGPGRASAARLRLGKLEYDHVTAGLRTAVSGTHTCSNTTEHSRRKRWLGGLDSTVCAQNRRRRPGAAVVTAIRCGHSNLVADSCTKSTDAQLMCGRRQRSLRRWSAWPHATPFHLGVRHDEVLRAALRSSVPPSDC